jgi:hypothetical protein
MSDILAQSRANLGFGIDDVVIGGVTYSIASIDIPFEEPRVINRSNGYGVRKDYVVTKGSEPIQGTMELERELTTTLVPESGVQFTYDANDDGTDETYQVLTSKVNRSKDAMDTITLSVIRLDDGFGNL